MRSKAEMDLQVGAPSFIDGVLHEVALRVRIIGF